MATSELRQANVLRHYQRITSRRGGPSSSGLEAMEDASTGLSDDEINDRTEIARESLRGLVEKYYNNDPHMLEIVNKIIKEGGDSLRQLAGGNIEAVEQRPLGLEGLEAIVRTDGSRPSFLIRDGGVDRDSSPLGDWGSFLDDSDEALRRAVASVGRIDVPGSSVGFQGTGFLISDNLILTNRHVLQVSARQLDDSTWRFVDGATIDFGHEFEARTSVNRRRLMNVVFSGAQSIDFNRIDHRKLDLALIELAPAPAVDELQQPLSLDVRTDWTQPGTIVYTIGYPGSPPSFVYPPTLLEQLFQATYGYKRLAPGEVINAQSIVFTWTLTHDATTLGGNSGSVVLVFRNEGAAAGLHYGGRASEPRENWGHVLSDVLDETGGRSPKSLRQILTDYGVAVARNDAPQRDGQRQPTPSVQRPSSDTSQHGSITDRSSQPTRDWRGAVTLATMRPLLVQSGRSRVESAFLEAAGDGETHPDDLEGRSGYLADFIPGWNIPLPQPAGDMRALRRGGSGVELKYEHFSVIMSASRRMPIITACNIKGGESRRMPRITQWSYDGRLDQDDQWGNDLYQSNDLDRGHMVRREDPVWGPRQTARRANVDTFHYTNSCPQMAGVNQAIWLGLEDYVLNHIREDEMLVSVFTGPIFTARDLPYRDALIPKTFWKVVAFVTDDGRPSATAYKVSQARELQDLEFVFAGYKTFQISIQQVADATGIDFDALIPFDGFSQHERVHGTLMSEQLESFSQIRV